MKKILLVGATKGGGIATINCLIVDHFIREKIPYYLLDKSKIFSKNKVIHYLIYYFKLFIILAKKRSKIRFTIVHISESVYPFQVVLNIICKLFRVKNIAYYHGQPQLDYLNKKAFKLTNNYIDIIFAISKKSIDEFIKLGRSKPVFYTPNFISEDLLDLEDKSLKKDGFLYIGRMEKSKGIFRILNLAEQFPNQKFKFVGNFENKNEEREFCKQIDHLNNAVWLGSIYSDEKYKIIQESKLLLFFTNRDCFPLTILECGYFGVPCIVTATGAIPEFISNERNGLLINSPTEDQIINAFNKVLKQKSLISTMGKQIKSDTINNYTSNIVVKELIDKIDQIAS